MEAIVVATVVVALSALVVIAVVAACTRFVPEGSVAITRRLGRRIDVQASGKFRALPILDSASVIAIAPFSRQVTFRSTTRDGLDIGATVRVHLQPVDAALFDRNGQAFDDRHEQLIRAAIAAALIGRSHPEVLAQPEPFRCDVEARLASQVRSFGLVVSHVEVEQLRPSRTGAPATRPVGVVATRVPGPVEVLELARRERESRLNPPNETDFDFSLAALLNSAGLASDERRWSEREGLRAEVSTPAR